MLVWIVLILAKVILLTNLFLCFLIVRLKKENNQIHFTRQEIFEKFNTESNRLKKANELRSLEAEILVQELEKLILIKQNKSSD